MTKVFLLILSIILNINVISQTKKTKGSVGISIPIIWNQSEAAYYQLGSPKYQNGNAISYGLNINYSQPLYKGFYVQFGIGYFKQVFHIPRPFAFDDPTNLLFYTKSYEYDNIQVSAGIGYRRYIKNRFFLKGLLTYNQFYSYRQKYIPQYTSNSSFQSSQTNHKSISLGSMFNLSLGFERMINNKFSVGMDAMLPIYTHWNKDEIFFNNFYSNNEQQIARNKFSIGTAISCYYHFLNH